MVTACGGEEKAPTAIPSANIAEPAPILPAAATETIPYPLQGVDLPLIVSGYPAPEASTPAAVEVPARPYRPASLLLPQFWTPLFSFDEEQSRFGAGSGGADPLLRHAWGAQALYGTQTERLDWSAFYAYDRWRPTFLAVAEEQTEIAGEDHIRTRTLDVQAALPLRRTLRSSQTLSLTWRRERDETRTSAAAPASAPEST